nr:immunoglobulin heavy chain junction region [Macaca mulatta]MOW98488.1 immunoglobulin heavy chain junction region [Macaca mulatta]MOX00469.1 immunoglobulin heavy chain junction region [Macaca mulatta]MOX05755.1 immunoglobulin heavy chain junction region [Macaca mulatta]
CARHVQYAWSNGGRFDFW